MPVFVEGERLDPELRWASFSHTALDDDGLERVCRVATLENLDLQWTEITNDGLVHLARLPRLRHLRLKENQQLDDRCVDHLLRLRALVDLQLHETSITLAGLDRLDALDGLTFLVVDGDFALDDLRGLSARMPKCTIVVKGRGELDGGQSGSSR